MPSRYDKYATHLTSRRTDDWDYTQPATYFVTICTEGRLCLFGEVRRGRVLLNPLGTIVVEEWRRSEDIRDRVHLDAFVVMPNHLHGIVVFADLDVEAPTCPRGYRAFETAGGSENPSKESNSEKASTGGSANRKRKIRMMEQRRTAVRRLRNRTGRTITNCIVHPGRWDRSSPGSNPPRPRGSIGIGMRRGPRCGNGIITT